MYEADLITRSIPNETASTTKAVSRPKAVEITPPNAAPTASIVPHNEPFIAFAIASGVTPDAGTAGSDRPSKPTGSLNAPSSARGTAYMLQRGRGTREAA